MGAMLSSSMARYTIISSCAASSKGAPVNWRGSSDTETLIECFSAWGASATLRKAVGMFALALWDRAERRLTLARDRFGEKPLYYGYLGQGPSSALVFGSELKALRAPGRFDNAIDRNVAGLVSALFICSNALLDLS